MKIKLIRRGRLAGLVQPSFYGKEEQMSVWEELEITPLTICEEVFRKV